MTHFATADSDEQFLARQLDAFEPFAAEMRALAPGIVIHAANSAATLRSTRSHFDMVRCGIAIYGCDPMNEDPARWGWNRARTEQLCRRGEAGSRRGEHRVQTTVHRCSRHMDRDLADRL